jgi:hypothetical protein
MRTASILFVALVVKLGSGVALGAPIVVAKKAHASSSPVGIVAKPTVVPLIESERVELDVRQPVEPLPPDDSATAPVPATRERAAPKPIVRAPAPSTASEPPRTAAAEPGFAALVAARVDELPMCRRGDAAGAGVAEVVFLPEGAAKVKLSEPYANTATGACVARRLGRDARPHDGEPIVVRVRFSL